MNERQSKLLVTIINQFIHTAIPVGSKKLVESGIFSCSSATLRNEMLQLEDEGFLEQPHVSAGRVPSAKGYRAYVQEFMEPSAREKAVMKQFETLKDQYLQHKDQERVYDAVAMLSQMTPNVAFASVPHKDQVFYLGLANVLRLPEFLADPRLASGVAEVLEKHLSSLLEDVTIDDHVRYYIGEKDVLPKIQSCSLMAVEYSLRGEKGVLGILGPMRMDYSYNTIALKLASDLLGSL
jgi:transcriptional regulator of heat shock response